MKPLRGRIEQAAHAGRLPQPVIEKDYALSYLLAGVAGHPALADTLIFKGGTALKKLFFGEYRVSEDLDFSTRVGAPKGNRLEASLREAATGALNLLTGQGPFSLEFERYLEREPHPQGQEAFIIRLKFPWHPGPMCRIKLEVSHDEPVLLAPERRTLIHGYGEDLAIKVSCYALEEIVAEKLRTLLQTQRKLLERGWNRPRARDYYDLWRILEAYGEQLDPGTINRLLIRKCEHRGVAFSGIDDFFGKELIAESRRHWQANLGQFVDQLPPCETVLMRLRELMQKIRPVPIGSIYFGR